MYRERFILETKRPSSIDRSPGDRAINHHVSGRSNTIVRDGVRALLERDAAVERWLREEVVSGHKEYLAEVAGCFNPIKADIFAI